MKMKIFWGIPLLLFVAGSCFAQTPRAFKTWIPADDATPALEGRGWTTGLRNYYDRLPEAAEKTVRPPVWKLSNNSAGLNLRFRSDADEIVVKYVVTGNKEMPHMPATGVSGVDLYVKSIDGPWLWCAGKYDFKDTIVYRFSGLKKQDQHVKNFDYTLYLPLYNSVKWLSVSVPEESLLQPLPVRKDLPIVIYGTSIAQGGCASRPGLGWTSILGRKLETPVINLAFSGNGRLEPEVLDFIGEQQARLFVLDCLPNLTGAEYAGAELKRRITNAVTFLQRQRPGTPILLTEHDGYTGGDMNEGSKTSYKRVNATLREVFDSLQHAGTKNIYLLTEAEIGQDIESMVDGTHPNDIGMMHYADAYAKKIRSILHEESGGTVTTTGVTQRRDANTYDWQTRHEEVLAYNKTHQPKVVFMGNSITHFWGGTPVAPRQNGSASWAKYFEPKQAVNLGFGWDRVENVLWRVQHGELDGIAPEYLVLMIGTNNLQANTDEEIADGIKYLLQNIQARQPATKVILMAILPRRNMESRVVRINQLIAKRTAGKNIQHVDAGKLFLQANGKINEALFSDGLHPNQEGYERLGALINKQLVLSK